MSDNHSQRRGRLELIAGTMFSGKTEELLRRWRRLQIAKVKTMLFKPTRDTRTPGLVSVHDGCRVEAIEVPNAAMILFKVHQAIEEGKDIRVVMIDEVEFLSETTAGAADYIWMDGKPVVQWAIVSVVRQLVLEGIRVVVAGLDVDFRGLPFGPMAHLYCMADKVTKLTAICVKCGLEANMVQRLIDGQPASWNAATVAVGAGELYQAVCPHCYIWPIPSVRVAVNG